MLEREHSAILSTFIKLAVVIKTFVLSIFEWLFYTGFTVSEFNNKVVLLIFSVLINVDCFPTFQDSCHLLVTYFANNMDPDQTALGSQCLLLW